MAKFLRIEVLNQIFSSGLIPIYYDDNNENLQKVISACYSGGSKIFELTSD